MAPKGYSWASVGLLSQKTVGIKGNQIIILIQLSNKRGKVKKYKKVGNKTFWVGGGGLLNLT
jgi:hypothetical protein